MSQEFPTYYRRGMFCMVPDPSGQFVHRTTFDAATGLCRTYFDIAAGAIGDEAVRSIRDHHVENLVGKHPCDEQGELLRLRARNEALSKALQQRVIDETVLQSVGIEAGQLFVGVQGGAAGLLVAAFGDMLMQANTPNYVEMQFTFKGEPMLVHLQRRNGKTPHQLRADAVHAVADLVAAIEEAGIAGFGVIEAEGMAEAVQAACMAVGPVAPEPGDKPAELAEQQGAYIGMPVGEKTVARAVASLEQSLTFGQDFRAEDVRIVLAALAATGKRQAGQVQGDAVEHAKNLDLLRAGYHVDAQPRAAALDAAIAALTARQPVGQVPAVWVSPEQLEAHADPQRGEGGHYLPARKSTAGKFTQPLYRDPPAPGINLERLRELADFVDRNFNATGNADPYCYWVAEARALIAAHTDAAPGVQP